MTPGAEMTRPTPPIVRWEKKVDKTDDHWLWTGTLTPRDYGRFWNGVTMVYAHRWGYAHLVGSIPPGYEVDHVCFVHACVKPDHLEAVTPEENMRRSMAYHFGDDLYGGREDYHGTRGGYANHGCRCPECCEASTEAARRWRDSRTPLTADDPRHGTTYAYGRGCRCEPCREANRAANGRKPKLIYPQELRTAIFIEYWSDPNLSQSELARRYGISRRAIQDFIRKAA